MLVANTDPRRTGPRLTPLEQHLREQIVPGGPVRFDTFMEACMRHPQHGYYTTRDPLGQDGDFTTGPEISQMFGEMIAMWCVDTWIKMGEPEEFVLAEGGPGRGTLMDDILRTVKVSPKFMNAARVFMIEKSPALREKQAKKLANYKVRWCEELDELPALPTIFFANELLDTFAIRRFLKTAEGWQEQAVGLQDDRLALVNQPILPAADRKMFEHPAYVQSPVGAYAETSPDCVKWMEKLSPVIAKLGGGVLLVDYGYEGPMAADTVQAIRAKKPAPLLEDPGEADITAYVDFSPLRAAAEAAGLKSWPVRLQRDFLLNCGILHRVKYLKDKATTEQLAKIDLDLERLLSANQMGVLFKIFCTTHPSLPTPLGF
jgi:NADH dehydrogenase [ubiquinone] 1 alpha subcomplex assembly factor 7